MAIAGDLGASAKDLGAITKDLAVITKDLRTFAKDLAVITQDHGVMTRFLGAKRSCSIQGASSPTRGIHVPLAALVLTSTFLLNQVKKAKYFLDVTGDVSMQQQPKVLSKAQSSSLPFGTCSCQVRRLAQLLGLCGLQRLPAGEGQRVIDAQQVNSWLGCMVSGESELVRGRLRGWLSGWLNGWVNE